MSEEPVEAESAPAGFWALTLGSVGVVYGDIGTSPLYAFREALHAAGGHGAPTPEVVLGILSLILWALIIVVTAKYVLLLLRIDNKGEGGTLSLTALANRALGRRAGIVFLLGVIGAAMFYADSLITPAISVLSAVEGLKLVAPAFGEYVVPIAIGILVGLFAVQRRGTAGVAVLFGPIMVAWFATLAITGAMHIADAPAILAAINPYHALRFLTAHGGIALVTMGLVFLAVTGGEALYADLGHFGRKPIQAAWFGLVLPSLLLNYFGQGALVLADPTAAAAPFYRLVPAGLLPVLIVLATAATIIASQAVITGAYSLTQQAIQLGLLPRFDIRYTSGGHKGQIYIPRVNIMMLTGVLLLVILFQTSSTLASAYGIAVATTMVVDGLLAFVIIWKLWGWRPVMAALLVGPLVLVDLSFFAANLLKIFEKAWLPLVFAAGVVLLIATWQTGTAILRQKTRRTEVELESLVASLARKPPPIVPGMAVFLTSDPDFAPTALLHNLKHNKVLHERNVILTIVVTDEPRVPETERVGIRELGERFIGLTLTFGFMEAPNVPRGLAVARRKGFKFDIMTTSFFLSRRALKPAAESGMPIWQDRVFIAMARSASDASDFFQIPTGRVVEIGTQVTV
jgi:KUP system potassium uptake protein